MNDLISRRSLIAAMAVAPAVLPATSSTGGAQGGSPVADPGLPALHVTVSASGYDGIAATIPAGRYVVHVSVVEDTAEWGGGGVNFIRPAGMSPSAFLAAMAPPGEDGEDGSPDPAGPGEETLIDVLANSLMAGGAAAETGGTASAVLDLPPGEWIAWADDPWAPQAPVVFEVTGTMPADVPEPEAGATMVLAEYSIEVSGGSLAVGTQVVRLENRGTQPHYIEVLAGPAGMTAGQVVTLLQEDDLFERTGTPVTYSNLTPADVYPIAWTATISQDVTAWVEIALPEPGTHALACFYPDLLDGTPHALHGMATIIDVAG